MWRRGSNKYLLFFSLFLFQAGYCLAQQVLEKVRMERITPALFRVHYSLEKNNGLKINSTVLKILRKRKNRIDEIYSGDITGSAQQEGNGSMVYSWVPPPGTVATGDQLQAKITVNYQRQAIHATGKNQPPKANAGSFREIDLPLHDAVRLNGTASRDADGNISRYSWKQIAGPETVELTHADSVVALIPHLTKEGSYAFELTVTDGSGAQSTDRLVLTARTFTVPVPAAAVTKNRDSIITNSTATLPGGTKTPAKAEKKLTVQPLPPLKGGPSNALVNLLVPGLGHHYVSGNYLGQNRKNWPFIITAVYVGAAGGSVYYLLHSNDQYNRYKELAAYREYQHDASGNVIGVRGGNEAEAEALYASAKRSQDKARLLAGVGGAILVADFAYTLWKGNRNRQDWKKHQSTSFFISSSGTGLTAGIRVKL